MPCLRYIGHPGLRLCRHCLSRLAIVLDKDPSFSDFVLLSSKCGKIIAVCIAKIFLLFSIKLFRGLLRVSIKF